VPAVPRERATGSAKRKKIVAAGILSTLM
jgi:hypothetical protein